MLRLATVHFEPDAPRPPCIGCWSVGMSTIANQVGTGFSAAAAYAAIAAIAISCAALILLHISSPEFALSWRMVSEYANGRHAWLLLIVFLAWALSSFALAVALSPLWPGSVAKVGLFFLVLAGVGQTMGGLFDINHKLHGPAAMIGIPSLCIAAVLLAMAMSCHAGIEAPPMWSAHLPWMAFAAMIGAFALFFSALKSAGVDVSGQAGPLKELPSGGVKLCRLGQPRDICDQLSMDRARRTVRREGRCAVIHPGTRCAWPGCQRC
jgi:hypothetical protein